LLFRGRIQSGLEYYRGALIFCVHVGGGVSPPARRTHTRITLARAYAHALAGQT